MPENPYQPSMEYGADPDFVPPVRSTTARPMAVTIFGILNLVFGAFGLMGFVFSMAAAANIANANGMGIYYLVSVVYSLVTSILLIVAGIGLLRWKPWGRRTSIIYGWTSIAGTVLMAILQYFTIWNNEGFQGAGSWALLIGVGVGIVFQCIYPGILLAFMYGPTVSSALSPVRSPFADDAQVTSAN